MNIFFLSENSKVCAKYHCDKHVVKMIVEYAQLLSTAHRASDGYSGDSCYKTTHKNHPSAIWSRESDTNYVWLYDYSYLFRENILLDMAKFILHLD